MPTLDDVYRKFGEVSEAAQIVETDLGTVLMFFGAVDEGIITPTLEVDSKRATDLMHRINGQTFGQLLRNTKRHTGTLDQIEPLLSKAVDERNRLTHSFYRQHNFRRNSEPGRAIMMQDLEEIHETLLQAMRALSLLQGIDLDELARQSEVNLDKGESPSSR
ncbi:MAG: hypothetical protein IH602_04415, partial [Bryobacteraceae bacterium]|nr:hypothetical protein [Bryobacteraceae bacterium]